MITIRKAACGEEQRVLDFYYALMVHDLGCTNPADMYYPELAKRADYLKNDEKGVRHMCQIMENVIQEDRKETVLLMAADNEPIYKIAKYTRLTEDQVKQIIEENKKKPVGS
jgi:hypothetical protein